MVHKTIVSGTAEIWTEISGEGIPVVLSHGGPGLCDNLGGVAEMLADRFLTVRYDQRGCHRSTAGTEPMSVATLIEDMEAVRRSLGVEKWIVGGHSWGANLSLLYALEYPHRTQALLYLSGGGVDPNRVGSSLEQRRSRLTPDEWDELQNALADPAEPGSELHRENQMTAARLFWLSDFSDRSAAPNFHTDPLYPVPRNGAVFSAVIGDFKTRVGAGVLSRMSELDVPALVLRGQDDPIAPELVRQVAEHLPRSSYVELEGVGHTPWLERPELLRAALDAFLAQSSSSASTTSPTWAPSSGRP
ncbi:alpha/beta fold hydrolase [Kitasatospora cineracea]|uniref:alpha/beta fold hydrolase n=1 Tax=Kitasatospora cineracea TaxID=88074 RepID=UPI0033FB843C